MLYLEDYLEIIENLPNELKERLIDVRELDLELQSKMDEMNRETGNFFTACPKMKAEQRDMEYKKVRDNFVKAISLSEDKMTIATDMYNMVEKYHTRLDTELEKFKNELEADNAGITEQIERKAQEQIDQQIRERESRQQQLSLKAEMAHAARRKQQAASAAGAAPSGDNSRSSSLSGSGAGGHQVYSSDNLRDLLSKDYSSITGPNGTSPNLGLLSSNHPLNIAATNALLATKDMHQGRRTQSLKASIEAISNPGFPPFNVNLGPSGDARSNKRSKSSEDQIPAFIEPDEQTYCTCKQVSFGDMVACDNEAAYLLPPKGNGTVRIVYPTFQLLPSRRGGHQRKIDHQHQHHHRHHN